MPALDPIVIDNAAQMQWDEEVDVVVVGFGGAGVVAAIEAREIGADVLAIDRFCGGGATAYSGGTYYAGGGTRYQKEEGIDDTPEDMFKYLTAEGSVVAPETLSRFCEGSSADLAWIDKHGVPHGGHVYYGKTAYPPNDYYLFFSGNELLPGFEDIARPAPRGHRVRTNGYGGHVHFRALRDSALALGVRLMTHAPVTRLVMDGAGRVVGVEANRIPATLHRERERIYKKIYPWKLFNSERAEQAIAEMAALEQKVVQPYRVRARGAVILSTGGFVYNLDMLKRHRAVLGRNYRGLCRLGSMGCDGSGIVLGKTAGGVTAHMDRYFLGRPLSPPEAFIHGIMVNIKGQRFVNEDAYQSVFGNRLIEQGSEGRAWLILDRATFWLGIRQILLPKRFGYRKFAFLSLLNIVMGGTRSAFSLRRLAQKCGIDASGLADSWSDYNRRAGAEELDPLGKSPSNIMPLGGGPFYAVNVSLNNRYGPTFCFSLGGLVVNEDTGEVLKQSGESVAGLLAAGRAAVGLCSGGYMTGMAIADTVFSGRRAGSHGARAALRQQ